MHGSILGYLLLFQALFYIANGRNKMLLAPEFEMQTVNSTELPFVTKQAASENGAGARDDTLVSLVVDSQKGVNVTYLNLTITSSDQGPARIVSLEPLPPSPPVDETPSASRGPMTEQQDTGALPDPPAVEEVEMTPTVEAILTPSPEIEQVTPLSIASVNTVPEEAPHASEPTIEEVPDLAPVPVPEPLSENSIAMIEQEDIVTLPDPPAVEEMEMTPTVETTLTPSPEIEQISPEPPAIEEASDMALVPVPEPAMEENIAVSLSVPPPLAEREVIIKQQNYSDDAFLRLVPAAEEVTPVSLERPQLYTAVSTPAPEPEPESLVEELPVPFLAAPPTARNPPPAVESQPPIRESPLIEAQNNSTTEAGPENAVPFTEDETTVAPAPVAEVVQQQVSPPPPPPPPPTPPPPSPPPTPAPQQEQQIISILQSKAVISIANAVPTPENESNTGAAVQEIPQYLFDVKTAPEPEVQPATAELTDRILQSLSGIGDTLASITTVMRETGNS